MEEELFRNILVGLAWFWGVILLIFLFLFFRNKANENWTEGITKIINEHGGEIIFIEMPPIGDCGPFKYYASPYVVKKVFIVRFKYKNKEFLEYCQVARNAPIEIFKAYDEGERSVVFEPSLYELLKT